ncbi:MAG TPA: TetR family transcriptional regulator [Flavisolibacter sp.]|nr:TetR family transcriptional regulator [Flavisolibacter sp.]
MSYYDKKTHILNVAEKLFAQKGFDGTSVRDIAEAACVNVSMISYYFGSKEKLMESLFEDRTSHIFPKLEQLVKDTSITPFGKIEHLIDDYINRAQQKLMFHKILVGEQVMEKNTIISSLINDLKKKHTELLELLIEEGQNKGCFKEDLDIILMVNTLIGTTQQTFINQQHYRKFNQLESMSDPEFEQFLKLKTSKHIKELFKSILKHEA